MTAKADIYGGKNPWDLPSYTIPMAARFARVPPATLRSWVVGRAYATKTGSKHALPIIHPPALHTPRLLSFTNLVEAHVLSSMRRVHEIEMKKVRNAIAYVQREFEVEHPLAKQVFRTNGVDLFVKRLGKLINVSSSESKELRSALEQRLERIVYFGGSASELYPLLRDEGSSVQPKLIVINPLLLFGRPVFAGTAIAINEIIERFRAGDSSATLAEDFEIDRELVDEAMRISIKREAA